MDWLIETIRRDQLMIFSLAVTTGFTASYSTAKA